MAVDRGNLTPEPSTANHYPQGRTATQIGTRGSLAPPNQASIINPALSGGWFNQALQT